MFLSFAAGRRGKWFVLLFWIVAVAAVAPFGGKLFDATKNDAASYLPGSAESTRVLDLEKQFPSGQTTSALIVYYRDSGLTTADKTAASHDRDAVASSHLTNALEPTPLVTSQDGKAMLFTVPFSTTDWIHLGETVKTLRGDISQGGNGLDVKVTGPAGYAADFTGSFGNLDTQLLLITMGIVAVLLLLTYRSPFLWLFPLISVLLANQIASGAVYGLAKSGLTVSGFSAFILIVLTFGVGTDYALLLVSRYREELRRHDDRHEAMRQALHRVSPAIIASAATVTVSLLCLVVAELNSTRDLGPVVAIGVVLTLIAMLTLLPALLVIFGRWIFWPFVPRLGSAAHEESGLWSRIGGAISRAPRLVWIATVVALAVLALGLFDVNTGLTQAETFRDTPDSVIGQQLLARSFPSGSSQPATVIVQPASKSDAAHQAASSVPGVASVSDVQTAGDLGRFSVTLTAAPGSNQAFDTIKALRTSVKAAAGPGALVGGDDAVTLDTNTASAHDDRVVIPLVLLVVVVILGLLLRSVVAPLLLIGTVILSFAAALGVSAVVFDRGFGFAGQDVSLPLQAFIFLVALGVDYNIFLMARVHEEARKVGTRQATLTALAVTGGVITSAGMVLAGTFAALTSLPLVTMVELGFTVSFGVLLDTLIVRSILVPALSLDVGRRLWWPSGLSRRKAEIAEPEPAMQYD
jgi:RND superfamily putative drug exporter